MKVARRIGAATLGTVLRPLRMVPLMGLAVACSKSGEVAAGKPDTQAAATPDVTGPELVETSEQAPEKPLPDPGPPPAALMDPAKVAKQAPPKFRTRFQTSAGAFVLEVTRAWAPYSADRFFSLVQAGYFDGMRFFDVSKGVTVGFGVHGHPKVTKAWFQARILDDIPKWSNRRGLVSFVSYGPLTRTTNVLINLKDNPALDARGAVPFGAVISGMAVVDKLYSGYGPAHMQDGSGPDSGRVVVDGNAYLAARFPKLDYIESVHIEDRPGQRPRRPSRAQAKRRQD